jgi:DNA topoisomerase 2-associated protein PAT1
MTQSDKDFITTRIQASQQVTQDPYADDFYAQVYLFMVRYCDRDSGCNRKMNDC